MNRLLSLCLSATLTVSGMLLSASALGADNIVRVGLNYGSNALELAQLENVGDITGYTVGTMDGTTFQPDEELTETQITMGVYNGKIRVLDSESGQELYAASEGAELAIRPNSELTWFKGYQWRGDFVYRIVDGSLLSVLNYVNMEDYVKGVLPYEMDADWPVEALKAQAVCARSFALSTHKHDAQGFDVCNTTNCQVYLGASRATENSDAAVDATAGEYLTYNGEIAAGYFFSSDGGGTEDAANVWGGDYPYLKGKLDPYEDVENAYNGVWSVEMTPDEIEEKLDDAGYDIGTVVSAAVTKRTPTDNVAEVTVIDEDGRQVTVSGDNLRTVFGLNSIRFTITPHTILNETLREHIQKTVDSIGSVGVSTHKVAVDGMLVAPQGYLIDRENYYKLRDVAYILNGTDAQFNVEWDAEHNRIILTGGDVYQTVGGELSAAAAVNSISASQSVVQYNGQTADMSGYLINGNNYYRIRDVAKVIGFDIDFDDDSDTVQISSILQSPEEEESLPLFTADTIYVADRYTFDGTGWGHSVGMSQYGALGMAQLGMNYREILEFYYTDITISV